MSEGNGVDPEAGGDLSKEALFPNGMPGTREWNQHARSQREAAAKAAFEGAVNTDEPEEEVEAEENLAEAQVEESEGEEAEEAQEVALERMRLKDFLNAAGVTMEEFYRDIVVERDGEEVPVSQAWDDYKTLKDANTALLRERSELQEKVKQGAVSVPQQQYSPEAQALLQQAQMYQQALDTQDWSQVENSANVRLEYMAARDKLVQQAQAKQGEWQQELTKKYREALEEAERQTRANIPEWNDSKVREIEQRGIGDMLSAYGIKQQEIDTVIDPRWRRFFRDAFKARTQTERIAQGVKKIRKVGKSLPPGARAGLPKTPTLAGARAALKKAREAGANKVDIDTARLQVQLPDIKPGKRK